MRIIGGHDYYDGTAFRSDGKVLSLLVYRRDGVRRESRPWMESTLGVKRRQLCIRLHAMDDGPAPRRPRTSLFKALSSIAHVRWNGSDLRLDEGGALFCGTLRRCVMVRVEHAWSDGRTQTEEEWCWSVDALETALASRGLGIDAGWDRTWFDPVPVQETARRAGLCIATLWPGDAGTTRTSWRMDAPILGSMDFEQVLPAREALARIADWIGDAPANRSRTRLRVATSQKRENAVQGSRMR